MKAAAGSVDEYIAQFPPETQKALEELRALIRATAPGVTERISYGIPALHLNGKYLLYFAGYTKHVGLYPITGAVAQALGEELEPYKSGKATARFPLGQPLPTDLIRRIVELRVEDVARRGK
jgi:uncharacterized protein YdhG (YjbR/CyaY superfamily)